MTAFKAELSLKCSESHKFPPSKRWRTEETWRTSTEGQCSSKCTLYFRQWSTFLVVTCDADCVITMWGKNGACFRMFCPSSIFPNNFHRVLPLNTGDATNGPRSSTYLALLDSRQERTTILLLARCCWTSAAWRRRGSVKTADWDQEGNENDLFMVIKLLVQTSYLVCCMTISRGAALACLSSFVICSFSVLCFNGVLPFLFLKEQEDPPLSPPAPTWLLITGLPHLKGELLRWRVVAVPQRHQLPSFNYILFHGWKWIKLVKIECSWFDHSQI